MFGFIRGLVPSDRSPVLLLQTGAFRCLQILFLDLSYYGADTLCLQDGSLGHVLKSLADHSCTPTLNRLGLLLQNLSIGDQTLRGIVAVLRRAGSLQKFALSVRRTPVQPPMLLQLLGELLRARAPGFLSEGCMLDLSETRWTRSLEREELGRRLGRLLRWGMENAWTILDLRLNACNVRDEDVLRWGTFRTLRPRERGTASSLHLELRDVLGERPNVKKTQRDAPQKTTTCVQRAGPICGLSS